MVEYRGAATDRVYGALSSGARRKLVARLAPAPARVTDLAKHFSMSLAGVSKHIKVLEDAGLVRREISGREHLIRLEPSTLAEAAAWLGNYRRFWESRVDLLDRRLRESYRK